MSAIPAVGIFFKKLHNWYHEKINHKCHQAGCDEHHLNHHQEELLPNPVDREAISVAEVDNRFGQLATIMLMFDRKLLKTRKFIPHSQFVWFVSPDNVLSARWKNSFFMWDGKVWKSENQEPAPLTREEQFDKAIGLLRQVVAGETLDLNQTQEFLQSL